MATGMDVDPPNPVEFIKSTNTIFDEIIPQYKYQIQRLKELPNEFTQVNECFPPTKDALKHAIENLNWDEPSDETILTSATLIESRAQKLKKIFGQVAEDTMNTKDDTVLDCYSAVLIPLGKSHRVEVLMLGILRELDTLISNQPLKPNCNQTIQLKDIIDKLSKVKSSVPDEDFKTSGTNNTQNIATGGTGYQYNGRGQRIITGNGSMHTYNAPVTYNVLPDYDESTWRGKSHSQDRNPDTSDRVVGHGQLQHRPQSQTHLASSNAVNKGLAAHQGRPCSREDFQIAIICALTLEYDVVSLLFDHFWDEDESYGRARGDTNTYTTGRIGKYDVVLVLLPNMGTVAAAGAAASFRSSFPSLQLAFLVGICGGVPWNGENEIHLGDVVISKSAVQYDLGNQYHNAFVIRDTVDDSLGRPNKNIRSLVKSFETERIRDQLQQKACSYLKDIQNAAARKRRKFNYQYPGIANDKLFIATYRHKHRGQQPCSFCDNQPNERFCKEASRISCAELGCDEKQLVKRTDLEMRGSSGEPEIFVGRIASGNMVMRSGEHRDKIANEQNVIALEMEGAGVWDEIPCIIVKGVCDYADSHRNDVWQRYAAATAASVMKAILARYIMTDR